MNHPHVTLTIAGKELELSEEPRVVPATDIALTVTGVRSRTVRLDGQVRRLGTSTGLLLVDLKRSIGYHRLEVEGHTFWFATTDAKARLDGLEAMLLALDGLGTGWRGQLMFSDGSGYRDAHVLYGWLDQWADKLLNAAATVLSDPHQGQVVVREVSRRGGSGVDVPATLRLIRSDPARFLERHTPGAINVDGEGYVPQRVVRRQRRTTIDTIPNRRCVWLLVRFRQLVLEVAEGLDSKPEVGRILQWKNTADRLLLGPVASALIRLGPVSSATLRTAIESTDPRYRATYSLSKAIDSEFGWSPTSRPVHHFSYVRRSDEIYQVFVSSVVASAFGLRQTGPVLQTSGLAFRGPDLDLYLDCPPPATVMESWRARSSRPDISRPDVLLHRKSTNEVAVVDAKYRAAGGGASEDSRKEVSAYMALYGLPRIGIAYPGRGLPREISGQGMAIVEIPIMAHPPPDLQTIATAIGRLFISPPYIAPAS